MKKSEIYIAPELIIPELQKEIERSTSSPCRSHSKNLPQTIPIVLVSPLRTNISSTFRFKFKSTPAASSRLTMRVLISGAGVAGPTLAWFLARTGARVTVVEKSRKLLPHGQNVDLQGSAVTAVRKMGLLDEVRRCNTKETGTQFIDLDGKPFASFPIKEGSSASPTSEYEILRADLAALLFEATKDHPHVEYLFGTTITEVITNDDDTVKVNLSNGETQEFDLLVAADGQWSKVRKQCFPPASVKSVHTGMYAVYFTIPRLSIDNTLWNIYVALKSRIVAVRPDPHGESPSAR
jgi:2-polyprenyl-6-methoxyphenol hydroxylase-like FAD-dependent oxidoreductase